MNIHLAKLHIHVFVRSIYGFEVEILHIISGVGATMFPSQLQVYICCRPRANMPYIFNFRIYICDNPSYLWFFEWVAHAWSVSVPTDINCAIVLYFILDSPDIHMK